MRDNFDAIYEIKDSQRLQTLYTINALIKQVEADGLEIHTVLPRILEVAVQQLNAFDGSIIVINEQKEVEHAWLTQRNRQKRTKPKQLESILSQGFAGWVIDNQRADIIYNTQTDPRWLSNPAYASSSGAWSVMCAPFLVQARAIGAITMHKPGVSQFNADDLNLLNLISRQAASIIENARLFAEAQRQLRVTSLLNEASKVINASLDTAEILQQLLGQTQEFFNAETVSIALLEPATGQLVYRSAAGVGRQNIIGLRVAADQGAAGWVIRRHEPLLVPNVGQDARFADSAGNHPAEPSDRAMLCAPVQHKQSVLGVIQALNPVARGFDRHDMQVMVSLANIASSAIANARQFSQTRAAEKRYVSLFEDSVDPIILSDEAGKIVEVNQRAVELFGYERREFLEMTIHALHAPGSQLPSMDAIQPDGVQIFVSQVIPKNRHAPLHLEVYARRTRYGDHALLQWIHHDITRQVKLDELRQDLTAMLVHDLQSPLGNVISSLELIRSDMPPDTGRALGPMLDIAIRSSNHLQALIKSLMDISRLEAGHPITKQTAVNVAAMVQAVYEIEEPNFEKRGVAFETDIPPELPQVYVEEGMIRRVLLNLLDNALKYSLHNPLVSVSARYLPETGQVLITVSDQGQGIPQAFRERIFKKFQRVQTREDSKGLGLGLAFCRLAVEAHKGRIWVDDNPAGGARFHLTLPSV
jgi:two-component system, NtrC family, sensor histidine kinase KinB